MTEQQKIYDEKMLKKILQNFSIQEMRFFASFNGSGHKANHWKEIDNKEAGLVTSKDSTNCVCLASAKRL
jgi:hypothetical protein